MALWQVLPLVGLVVAALAVTLVVVRRIRRARRVAPAIPRWPVVLVHGILGFDELAVPGVRPHYFRGISDHLERRGVKVYRPRLPPTASVPDRAGRLAEFLRAIPEAKVNVIAHSMGGLDARYAISKLGMADKIASLVTIGTPHRGSPVADLGASGPGRVLRGVAKAVGLSSEGVDWLTTEQAARFNAECGDDPRVLYGCVVTRTRGENPILWAPSLFVRRRAGSNDGLVPTASQRWGETIDELVADHWAQVGWSMSYDATQLYDRILGHLARRGL